MKAKRRTEITLETHETTIIRFRQTNAAAYCAECQRHTSHLSVAQAVSVLSLSESAVLCLAKDKKIHSSRTADAALLLCSNSLAALAQE